MKKIIVSLIIMLLCNLAYTQEKITLTLTDKTDLNQVFEGRYLFPDFQKALVYFRNATSEAMMNYNILMDRMLFIDAQGDTSGIKNADEIVLIRIGNRSFKYAAFRGYMEMLDIIPAEGISILIKRSIQVADGKKEGLYGTTSTTYAIEQYSVRRTSDTGGTQEGGALSISQDVSLRPLSSYYLEIGNKYSIANRSGFLKAFPKQKKAIDSYLKQNSVDFKNAADLLLLFGYCKNLL